MEHANKDIGSVEEIIENFFGIDAFSLLSIGGGRVPQSAS